MVILNDKELRAIADELLYNGEDLDSEVRAKLENLDFGVLSTEAGELRLVL